MNSECIKVGLIMGSKSDWTTMRCCADLLEQLAIPFEKRVISAHRTPDLMFSYAEGAKPRGIEVIIAAAGGAAHLPGMIASKTALPVIGVPVQSRILNGIDSLLSIVQMPAGIPVLTMSIGEAGAKNAALSAAAILANHDEMIASNLDAYRISQTQNIINSSNPST